VMRILRSSTIKYLLNIFDIPTIQAWKQRKNKYKKQINKYYFILSISEYVIDHRFRNTYQAKKQQQDVLSV
jgi:hypothetical protein